MTSYIKDGGHDVISHRKVLLSVEFTHSVCQAHSEKKKRRRRKATTMTSDDTQVDDS